MMPSLLYALCLAFLTLFVGTVHGDEQESEQPDEPYAVEWTYELITTPRPEMNTEIICENPGASPRSFRNNCCFIDNLSIYSLYSAGCSIGIEENYGSTGLFFYSPLCRPYNIWCFADGACHYFESGKIGASVGTGVRWTNSCQSLLGGVNLFYDYRDSEIGSFHQLGVGIEVIGNFVEMRANGYFPLSKNVLKGPTVVFDDYDNTGSVIDYQVSAYQDEFSLIGFDVETGVRAYCQGFSGYTALGAYYFKRDPYIDLVGGKWRLRIEYGRFIALEGQLTWDHVYDTNGRALIEVNIPFSSFCNMCQLFKYPCKTQRRVYRDGPVHLEHCCHYKTNY